MAKKNKEDQAPNYASLDDFPKELEKISQGTVFEFPEHKPGMFPKHGEAKFLIFYFDNKEDYDLVVKRLSVSSAHAKEHPIMNTKKLLELL